MVMSSISPVRALHITDLHILPTVGATIYGTDTYQALRAVLDVALALAEPPTLIIATGDLSEDGSPESYRRLRQLLTETGLPSHVLPGNHDATEEMRRTLAGGPVQMTPVIDVASWRVVLLDSQVRGKPHGLLDDAQLAVLASALAEHPDRPVLTCLHHGPARYCPSSGCHLQNADVLLRLLVSRSNARGVICGHGHLEVERTDHHVKLFTTPSTCSQASHAQLGEAVDHEDFWASHRFDPGQRGFRMLSLMPGGEITSRVHWMTGEAAPVH
jgi:3',5'-cyclic-AMP phosphodiesterase